MTGNQSSYALLIISGPSVQFAVYMIVSVSLFVGLCCKTDLQNYLGLKMFVVFLVCLFLIMISIIWFIQGSANHCIKTAEGIIKCY